MLNDYTLKFDSEVRPGLAIYGRLENHKIAILQNLAFRLVAQLRFLVASPALSEVQAP